MISFVIIGYHRYIFWSGGGEISSIILLDCKKVYMYTLEVNLFTIMNTCKQTSVHVAV